FSSQHQFSFEEVISDVWEKLESGKTILLRGRFSQALMGHLATLMSPNGYLWIHGEKKRFKGHLILLPEKNTHGFEWAPNQEERDFEENATSRFNGNFYANEPSDKYNLTQEHSNAFIKARINGLQ